MFEDESLENETMNETPEKTDDEAEVASCEETAPDEGVTEAPAIPEENPTSGTGYEYVFSSGSTAPAQKPQKQKRHLGLLITGICFSVIFTILFVCAVIVAGLQLVQNSDNNLSGGSSTTVRPNATVVLEKVERTGSEYGSAGEEVFAESTVVRMVKDAVVVIEATVKSSDFFGRSTDALSSGSGVVISADGYILTCNHVVSGATSVLVRMNDGKEYNAVLVGADSTSDLAVLKIEATDLTYVKQGCSADLVPGEHVIAIGNPLGTLGGTVTSGIISATERNIQTEDGTTMTLIQTDAAINSGNSGGGLFNLRGELIGIVNAKYASSGIEGLAFAIPVDSAFVVEEDLIQYGYVRGVIDDGMTTVDVTESNLSAYRFRYGITKTGLYVVESKYCDDLQNKDLILSINGKSVSTTDEWNDYLKKNCKVGDTLTVVAERDGKQFTTHLTLREYVPNSTLQ